MSEIRINSIEIENYRSFGEKQIFVLPSSNDNVPVAIIGYNNTGKSNLLNAIRYAVGNKAIYPNTFINTDLHLLDYNNNIKIQVDLESTTSNVNGIYTIETLFDGNEIEASMNPKLPKKEFRNNVFYINFHEIKKEISTQKSNWGSTTSLLAKHVKNLVERDNGMKEKKDDFIESLNLSLKNVLQSSLLSEFITLIESNYKNNLINNNCAVKFEMPEYEDIFLKMVFKVALNGESDRLLPINHFGDGFISMFVMSVIQSIAKQNKNDKCIFLFEEPESFLHENHQKYFYEQVLCTLAEKGHQVIYTTHSANMVDMFNTKGIIRLELDEKKQQTIKKCNEVTIENQEIINIDNFNPYIKSVEPNLNRILFSKKVVLVEGPNDLMAYKEAIKKFIIAKYPETKLQSNSYLNYKNITIAVHHGKDTAHLLIELCKHYKIDFFIITDWDIDEDFADELTSFKNLELLHKSNLYQNSNTNTKSMLTKNWKLINAASLNIHFNKKKLETVLGLTDSKDSKAIWDKINLLDSFDKNFFPNSLISFLEIDKTSQLFHNKETVTLNKSNIKYYGPGTKVNCTKNGIGTISEIKDNDPRKGIRVYVDFENNGNKPILIEYTKLQIIK